MRRINSMVKNSTLADFYEIEYDSVVEQLEREAINATKDYYNYQRAVHQAQDVAYLVGRHGTGRAEHTPVHVQSRTCAPTSGRRAPARAHTHRAEHTPARVHGTPPPGTPACTHAPARAHPTAWLSSHSSSTHLQVHSHAESVNQMWFNACTVGGVIAVLLMMGILVFTGLRYRKLTLKFRRYGRFAKPGSPSDVDVWRPPKESTLTYPGDKGVFTSPAAIGFLGFFLSNTVLCCVVLLLIATLTR